MDSKATITEVRMTEIHFVPETLFRTQIHDNIKCSKCSLQNAPCVWIMVCNQYILQTTHVRHCWWKLESWAVFHQRIRFDVLQTTFVPATNSNRLREKYMNWASEQWNWDEFSPAVFNLCGTQHFRKSVVLKSFRGSDSQYELSEFPRATLLTALLNFYERIYTTLWLVSER